MHIHLHFCGGWVGRILTSAPLVHQAYTAARESAAIIAAELAGVAGASSAPTDAVDFRVRASAAAREAVAVLTIEDGASLEMAVRLPPAWPLRPADVECRRKVWVMHGLRGAVLDTCMATVLRPWAKWQAVCCFFALRLEPL